MELKTTSTSVGYRPHTAFSLLLLGLLISCGSASDKETARIPVKIGVLAPFNTQPGEGIRNGVRMAVERINARGGLGGRPLEVVEINTEYSVDKAVRGYQRLAGREGVIAVLGVAGDGIFPIMEQLQRYRVPMITTGTGSDRLTDLVAENRERYRWFFRVMHKSSELGSATADFATRYLAREFKITKFAIMVEDDIWTRYLRDIWTEELSTDPETEIVFSDTFSSQTRDFSVLFQQITNSGAEYILDASSRVDATSYLKRWAAINGPPIGAVPTGAGTQRYYDLIGDDGLFVCSVATLPSPENQLTDSSAAWWESYYQQFGDPSYTSAYSYDAVNILAQAIMSMEGSDPESLITALEATDHSGVAARWVFDESHHPQYGPGYREIPILQYVEAGPRGFEIIWPPDRATAEFRRAH